MTSTDRPQVASKDRQPVATDSPLLSDLPENWLTRRSEAAGEPAWLRDRRLEAYKRALDQRWPDSRVDEYWRSTPFHRRFDVDVPVVVSAASPAGTRAERPVIDDAAATLTLLDGEVVATSLSDEASQAGVVATDLVTAAAEHAEVVEAHLGSLTTVDREGTGAADDRTITINDAAWTAGAFVHVPAGVELDRPIVVEVGAASAGAHLPRVLVVAERHSRAAVLVRHGSAGLAGGAALVDEVVEVVVGEAASVDVVSLQEWSGDVAHLSLQKAALHRDATYRHLAVNIGGATVRLRPEVDLVGEGASCFPLGIYFADDGQWFDMQPYIRHLAPRATSDVLYKGALQGRSRTIFRGNVLVAANAVGTDTNETNRSLILTDRARADSTPFLEIFCADITAGHGSATGQIDARQMFYLEARGIPRDEAVRLIVYGFFREVLDRVPLPVIRDRAMAHIEREVAAADMTRIGVTDAIPVPQDLV